MNFRPAEMRDVERGDDERRGIESAERLSRSKAKAVGSTYEKCMHGGMELRFKSQVCKAHKRLQGCNHTNQTYGSNIASHICTVS